MAMKPRSSTCCLARPVYAAALCVFLMLPFGSPTAAAEPERLAWQGHDKRVCFVAFSPDGKRIISGSWDWEIKVWDAATGKAMATLQEKSPPGFVMESMAVSVDGRTVASGKSADGAVNL